ncbi:fork head domain-containing protein FD4 [Anopheles cruzii]|uniref:fork head domain-containing protein FD4 n=1 Tax=Anopheles cruzii TaxID=68878 RepID=UPI0022EC532E|nr:fork head domain-containing protein FD4 [Anopheles cruzii]
MTQLEDDDLLNNLLKIPGTIIIYNNDMSSYDYVLNAQNVTLPLTPATSSAGSTVSEQSVDDLNSSASIDADMASSPVPAFLPGTAGAVPTQPFVVHSPSTSNVPAQTPSSVNSELDQSFETDFMGGASDRPSDGCSPGGEENMEELDDEIEEELELGASVADIEDDSEPELTNLSWLTELKNITNLTPSDVPLTDLPTARFNKFIAQVRRSRETYDKRKEQYTAVTNSLEKPPFNYAQIIAMAMLEEGRMTLKQICKWIQEKFAYYKVHKNWNNSIRHNLSLSFFFTKVQRAKDEKGKGGYWELSMDVSKSERRRVRVRQRNKSANVTTSGSSSLRGRSAARSPKRCTAAGSGGSDFGQSTNNNNELTVNHNLSKPSRRTPFEVVGEVACTPPSSDSPVPPTIDRNNNTSSQLSLVPVATQLAQQQQPLPVSSVTIDIIDNYGKPGMVGEVTQISTDIPTVRSLDCSGQVLVANTPPDHHPAVVASGEIPINEEQLIRASAMVENCPINFDSIINGETGASIFNNLTVDEIFSDNEIPQPANDDIIVPFFTNVQQVQAGPNVVVETIPYYLPDMGNFDESDFSNLININDNEISDEFLNEHGFL